MSVSNDVRKAMEETNARFCRDVVEGGKFDALDSIYTKGARIMPPGAPMAQGRDAIKSFWRTAIAVMGIKGVKLTIVDAETAGETVVEIGDAELQLGEDRTASAKYIVHWKHEDGQWRWDKDIWNMNS
jgi:ketosteroid isomerase-like protein